MHKKKIYKFFFLAKCHEPVHRTGIWCYVNSLYSYPLSIWTLFSMLYNVNSDNICSKSFQKNCFNIYRLNKRIISRFVQNKINDSDSLANITNKCMLKSILNQSSFLSLLFLHHTSVFEWFQHNDFT